MRVFFCSLLFGFITFLHSIQCIGPFPDNILLIGERAYQHGCCIGRIANGKIMAPNLDAFNPEIHNREVRAVQKEGRTFLRAVGTSSEQQADLNKSIFNDGDELLRPSHSPHVPYAEFRDGEFYRGNQRVRPQYRDEVQRGTGNIFVKFGNANWIPVDN